MVFQKMVQKCTSSILSSNLIIFHDKIKNFVSNINIIELEYKKDPKRIQQQFYSIFEKIKIIQGMN